MRKIKVIKLENNVRRIVSVNNCKSRNKIAIQPKNKTITPKNNILNIQNNQNQNRTHKIISLPKKPLKINQTKIIRSRSTSTAKNKYDTKIDKIKDCGIGKTLVMIACGPSVNEIDITKLIDNDDLHIMVINKPILSINPEYWAFCDNSQYVRNKDIFNQYGKLTITSTSVRAHKNNQISIKPIHAEGIRRDLREGYVIGRSSVYANIQVALWMNYDKIFIFGVDMCEVNGQLHRYGTNPDVSQIERIKRFKFEEYHYDIMVQKMPENLKQKIYFCSSYNNRSFTSKFNKLDHKIAIDFILDNLKCISKNNE